MEKFAKTLKKKKKNFDPIHVILWSKKRVRAAVGVTRATDLDAPAVNIDPAKQSQSRTSIGNDLIPRLEEFPGNVVNLCHIYSRIE